MDENVVNAVESQSSQQSQGAVAPRSEGKIDRAYDWYGATRNAYQIGRMVGFQSYGSMDVRKFNKTAFMAGVKSGYKGAKKYVKTGKVPHWVQKLQ